MTEQPRETTPLLASSESSSSNLEAGALVASRSTTTLCNGFLEQDSIGIGEMVKQETETLVGSSIPLILAYFLQFSFNFVNILSLGHLGADELAGAALANMTLFMLVNAPSVGLASALDTFCATSFTASPDKKL
ncbi:hypothetical protein LPJ73_008749, partial [Coemansia sp. RSA 2703]